MRKSRKLMSILLVVAMLFTLVSPAMAANTTISVAANDNRTYDVYQIFTGDLAKDENNKEILSNVKWGANGQLPENVSAGDPVAQTVLDALKAVNGLENDQEKLNVIKNYVNLSSKAYKTVSNAKSETVPTGYYLFVDKGVLKDGQYVVPDGQELGLYVVQVVDKTVISPKRDDVTSFKKVDDKNDSNTSEDAVKWQDSADYDIGDAVPFQLTGTVTEKYDYYNEYYFAFHDKESAGLTFDETSVKVYVDNTLITTGYEIITEGLNDDCTFEIVFDDLKAIEVDGEKIVKANSVITVEYKSILNDQAKHGSEGNPNVMYLEYSNNPNWTGSGDSGPGGEDDDEKGPTGKTPEDKVIVFTYKVVVNKVQNNPAYDKNDTDSEQYIPLTGAVFTLYKYDASATTEDKYVEVENKEFADPVFTWKGLDDGNYKLVETTTPPGYNTIEPIEFTITAEHEILSDNPALTSLSGNVTSGEVTFTPDKTDCSLTTNVVNNSGATLPETGGIGTTIFYVVGGALVLGAAVLLVTRRRMAE